MDNELHDRLRVLPDQLREAKEHVREFTAAVPHAALVLGSGFAGLIEEVRDPTAIEFGHIPHFPTLSVSGHRGELVFGSLQNVPVVISNGRKHLYEGEGLLPVLFPILLFRSLGARVLMLTNAAGGGHADWEVGDVMLIRDHLDSTFHVFTSPTREVAAASGLAASSAPPACPYSPRLAGVAREVAAQQGTNLREGVYVFSLGPFFETAAEVKALCRLGGDAFGMSTIPEALLGAALGMEVAGFSAITNLATGIAVRPHSHDEVVQNAARAVPRIAALITGILERVADHTPD